VAIKTLQSLAYEKLSNLSALELFEANKKRPAFFDTLTSLMETHGKALAQQSDSRWIDNLLGVLKDRISSSTPLQDCFIRVQEQKFINTLISRPDAIVKEGYGEYVFFLSGNDREELSWEMFEKVFTVFRRYSPASIIQANLGKNNEMLEQYANRYELISKQVKQIDPRLEIAFIPKTLYELFLIQKCIKEERKYIEEKGEVCKFLDPKMHIKNRLERKVKKLQMEIKRNQKEITQLDEEFRNLKLEDSRKKGFIEQDRRKIEEEIAQIELKILKQQEKAKTRDPKCWHRLCVDDPNYQENASEEIKNIFYRLNRSIVKKCSPASKAFSYQSLALITEKHIEFLKSYYQAGNNEVKKTGNCTRPGPSMSFRYESWRGLAQPTGLRDERDATILRRAVALECTKGRTELFLYRGINIDSDLPYCRNNKDIPFSLSFGTSLFAGIVFDQDGTPFPKIRNGLNGYVIAISIEKICQSPLYFPRTDTISQFYGIGDLFHGRLKVYEGFSLQDGLPGVQGRERRRLDHLRSELDKDELIRQFLMYQTKAIFLKKHQNYPNNLKL